MTTPRLPSNPLTMSDMLPQANNWSAQWVDAKYATRPLDSRAIESIQRDLNELQAWDNYERQTAESREAAKRALQKLLERATRG